MADDCNDVSGQAAPLQRRTLLKGTAGILASGMFPAVHAADPIVLRYLGTAVNQDKAIAEKFNSESAEQVAHRFGRVGTIDLRTDFLHQGVGKQFTATGRITRLGGRIASVQMTLENETGVLIATGCASYVIS